MLSLVTSGIALLISPPAMEVRQMAPITVSRSAVGFGAESIFPTTGITADLLDDLAAEQSAQDAAIEAKKAALKAKQAEIEAKAQADLEKQEQLAAERAAKKQAAIEEQAQKKAAAVAAAKEKAEKAVSSSPTKSKKSEAATPKASKYGTVQTINKQAERIAEREARGEEKPGLF
mmetsp:Transcript_6622/g.17213  ORF Transcript_6622/g.17213 Transcript_6622/m.17213 type:complete len:175 (+) Transcript_6622:253-777(+)